MSERDDHLPQRAPDGEPSSPEREALERAAKIADAFAKHESEIFDTAETDKALSDSGRHAIQDRALARKTASEAIALHIRRLTPRAVEKAGEPIDPADLWEEYLDQLEHAPSAQGALAFAVERLTATPSGADVRAALEPFARVAEHDIGESEHDDDLFRPMRTNHHAPLLTVGDFRRALAALTRPVRKIGDE